MRMTWQATFRCAASVALLTLISTPGGADDKNLPQKPADLIKVMTEAGKPGPEHARLDSLAGTWSFTCKFWVDPNKPPLESKGTIERKWILGGRFLEEKVVGTGFDGKPGFEGLGLIGYDNGRQKYTSNWACNMGSGICTGLGVSDPSGSTLTFQTESFCPLQKKVIKGREELRIESSDKTVAESYVIEDGKELKMMELVAVRTE